MLEAGQIDPSQCHVKNKVCSRVKISPRDLFASCYFAGRPGFRRHRSERNDISMAYPGLQQDLPSNPGDPLYTADSDDGARFSLSSRLPWQPRGPTLFNVGFGACIIDMCSSRNRVCMTGGWGSPIKCMRSHPSRSFLTELCYQFHPQSHKLSWVVSTVTVGLFGFVLVLYI